MSLISARVKSFKSLSNYAAAELRRVMGRKLADLEAEDADHHYAEAIHRDNMMIGAVV